MKKFSKFLFENNKKIEGANLLWTDGTTSMYDIIDISICKTVFKVDLTGASKKAIKVLGVTHNDETGVITCSSRSLYNSLYTKPQSFLDSRR